MSFLIYDDSPQPGGFRGPPNTSNPNRPYRKHLENYYYLLFMSENGSPAEKHQAQKELLICERKLKWWKAQPAFSIEQAGRDTQELKRQWKRD